MRNIEVLPAERFPTVQSSFACVRSVARIDRLRRTKGTVEEETVSMISSLMSDATRIGGYVRAHWSIENHCHWVLDVVLHEDESRIHDGNAAKNLTFLRRVALTLLQRDTSIKRSIVKKRKRADRMDDFRSHLLSLGNE